MKNITKKIKIIYFAGFLLIFLLPTFNAYGYATKHERIQAAITYLQSNQNPDGSWGERSKIRDTSEVARALHKIIPESDYFNSSIAWINDQELQNLDYLARKIEIIDITGTSTEDDINTLKNAIKENGWGVSERFGKDILSTIVIARALDSIDLLETEERDEIVSYILSIQNEDGSFSYYEKDYSSIYLTAEVVLFLKGLSTDISTYIDINNTCNRAGVFLLGAINPDGSIGSHLYETLAATRALLKLSGMTISQNEKIFEYIYSQQRENGSFEDDPFTTALGLALFTESGPNLAIKEGSVHLSNDLPQAGEKVTLTAVIQNLGTDGASDVNIKLIDYSNDPNGILLGHAYLSEIPSRETATVSLEFTMEDKGINDLSLEVGSAGDVEEFEKGDNVTNILVNVVDGIPPQIHNLSVNHEYISPNGDGIQDSAIISFELSEDSHVNFYISDERGLNEFLLSSQWMPKGINSLVWDGRDEKGSLVYDGRYIARIEAIDIEANIGMATISIVVDTNRLKLPFFSEESTIIPSASESIIWDLSYDGSQALTSGGIEQFETGEKITQGFTDIGTPPDCELIEIELINFSPNQEKILCYYILYLRHPSGSGLYEDEWRFCIDLYDTDGFKLGKIYDSTQMPYEIRWSPDSERIYFLAYINEFKDLFYLPATGSDQITQVTDLAPYFSVQDYSISLNSEKIAVSTRKLGQYRLDLYDNEGNKIPLYTGNPCPVLTCGFPCDSYRVALMAWSPDSRVLAVHFNQSSNCPDDKINLFGKSICFYNTFTGTLIHELFPFFIGEGFIFDISSLIQTIPYMPGEMFFLEETEKLYLTYMIPLNEDAKPSDSQPHDFYYYKIDINNGAADLLYKEESLCPVDGLFRFGVKDSHVMTIRKADKYNNHYNNGVLSSISPDKIKSIFIRQGHYYIFQTQDSILSKITDESVFPPDSTGVTPLFKYWIKDSSGILYWTYDPQQDTNNNFQGNYNKLLLTEKYGADNIFARILSVNRSVEDRNIIEVIGIAADHNFKNYTLEYLYLDDPDSDWVLITSGDYQVINGILARWDVRDIKQGYYLLKLTVTDKAGNVAIYAGSHGSGGSEVEWYFEYGFFPEGTPQALYAFYLAAASSVFAGVEGPLESILSPNGDGILDTVQLSYTLKGKGLISVWITNLEGDVVREIIASQGQDIGSYSYDWDGKDNEGAVVPDGDYIIYLSDIYIETEPEEIHFRTSVDTLQPEINITSPAPDKTLSGQKNINGTIIDLHFKEYTLSYKASLDANDWKILIVSHESVIDNKLCMWNTSGLNGLYQLKISASDSGANLNELILEYGIDNTAPSAWIVQPKAEKSVNGLFLVEADTNDLDVTEIAFQIKPENESKWTTLDSVILPQKTIHVDAEAYNHGYYNLRAIASDVVGNTDLNPGPIRFLIDKMPPISKIDKPIEDEIIRNRVTIIATSSDTDIKSIKFYYKPGTHTEWTFIGEDSSFPYSTVMDTTVIPDGYLYLRSVAEDTVGFIEKEPVSRRVRADNTLPVVSISDPASDNVIGGRYNIIGTAHDAYLKSYQIDYRQKGKVQWKIIEEHENPVSNDNLGAFDTLSLIKGEYEIMLSAQDMAGNKNSTIISVFIQNEAPQVKSVTTDSSFISLSPGSDKKTIDIDYILTEKASKVNLEVKNLKGNLVRNIENISPLAGENNYTYDCKESNSEYLADGIYIITISAYDIFNNASSESVQFTVDSISPIIVVTKPSPRDNVYGRIEVLGSINDLNLDSYSVFYGKGENPDTWTLAGSFYGKPDSEILAVIEASSLEGPYVIRITANDKAGNEAEELFVPVMIHSPSVPINGISISREYINYPPLEISFSLKREAGIVIDINKEGGNKVKTIDAGTLPAGTHSIFYDLTIDTSSEIIDGIYKVEIFVVDPLLNRTTTHEAGVFIRDTVPPTVSITAPIANAILTDNTIIEGEVKDENFDKYKISFGAGINPESWNIIKEDDTPTVEENLGIFIVKDLEGIYTLSLYAIDLTDNENETRVIVNVPTGAMGLLYDLTLEPGFISPNGDGIQDITRLNFMLGAECELTVTVTNESLDSNSPTLLTIFNGLAYDGEPQEFFWDGAYEDGNIVPDGPYHSLVRIEDLNTTDIHEYFCGTVFVDTIPPDFTIKEPLDESTVIDIVKIIIETEDDDITSLFVEIKSSAETQFTPFVDISDIPSVLPVLNWDTRGISGGYDLRVTMTDQAGNSTSKEISIDIADSGIPLLSDIALSNRYISPNDDGMMDFATLSFTVSRDTKLTAVLLNEQKEVIKVYIADELLSADDYSIILDGESDSGDKAADGKYQYVISAFDPLRGITISADGIVYIDSSAPELISTIPADQGFVLSEFEFTGQIKDQNLLSVNLSYEKAGMGINIPLNFDSNGNFSEFIESDVEDGSILLNIIALDKAGNKTESAITLYIDSTPPDVSLAVADEAETTKVMRKRNTSRTGFLKKSASRNRTIAYPVVSGEILLSYTATDTNLQSATLDYRNEDPPSDWIAIHEIKQNIVGGLFRFSTNSLADGVYSLRIYAKDFAGNENESIIVIDIDNTIPDISIIQPEDLAVITAQTEITGTVFDKNLLQYEVKLGSGDEPKLFDVIGKYTENVSNGVLHSWHPPEDEGIYVISIEAIDTAGNNNERSVKLFVDTIAPASPTGLKIHLNEEKQVVLEWNKNSESDVAGYRIYRDNGFIHSVPETETVYTDTDLESRVYNYFVTAMDNNGNESQHSETKSIKVDRTGPLVSINFPNEEDIYSGLIIIEGTAMSNDFSSYTLEFGEGNQPSQWNKLLTSPIQKVNDILGYYWSAGYNGTISFRLTGTDIYGNMNQVTVHAQIDNIPPASPQGFTAQIINTRDIQFTWEANTESDISGYNLMLYANRFNEEIITEATYTYPNAPDGDYSFTLVAIDNAGNLSVPTPPVNISLNDRTPHVFIDLPHDGETITNADKPLLVCAKPPDFDITVVQFQYKAADEENWQNIGLPQISEIIGSPEEPISIGTVCVKLAISNFPDGVYNLRAIGTDKTNQKDDDPPVSSFNLQISPRIPSGFDAIYDEGKVILTWLANNETDLAGYKVYRNNAYITDIPALETSFTDDSIEDGAYFYALSAFDTEGNESDKTQPKIVLIDTTPPEITITDPYDGKRVYGIADIIGDVTDKSSLTVNIEIGEGSTPTEYVKLHTFESKASFNIMYPLDTWDFADGEHIIRISASDAFNNSAVPVERLIIIDNKAPDPPADLVALPKQDGSIELNWSQAEENPPPTYNIYFKPCEEITFTKIMDSLSGQTFILDKGLKYGTHYCFAVTAVDNLGNESGYSNIAQAIPLYQDLPDTPVIYYPAAKNKPYKTGNSREDIVVWANTKTSVSLYVNESIIDTLNAPQEALCALYFDSSKIYHENKANEEEESEVLFTNPNDFRISIAPDGEHIAFIKAGCLSIKNNATGAEIGPIDTNMSASDIAIWNTEANRLAYTNSNKIKVYNLETGATRAINDNTLSTLSLYWSHDSSKIAAICSLNDQIDIWIFDANNVNAVQITFDTSQEQDLVWSPDDSRIAYDSNNRIYIFDLTHSTTTELNGLKGAMPDWSSDGQKIVFVGDNYIGVQDIVSETISQYSIDDPVKYPRWAPHGREILYSTQSAKGICTIGYDQNTNTFTEEKNYGQYIYEKEDLQCDWFNDGRIWVYSTDIASPYAYHVIEPRDRFVFKNVALEEKTNVFTAYAYNSTGERSAISEPVIIEYDYSITPVITDRKDLYFIGDRIYIIPNFPIQMKEVTIQATLKNNGPKIINSPIIANCKVKGPTRAESRIGDDIIIETLDEGEERVLVFTWTPTVYGEYEMIFNVDPYNDITESDETNNILIRPVKVNQGSLSVTIQLVKDIFVQGENTNIGLLFLNQSDYADKVDYKLNLEDKSGSIYETLVEKSVVLNAKASLKEDISWDIGNLIPGDFILALRAYSEYSKLPAEDRKHIQIIEEDIVLSASIIFDKQYYFTGDPARLSIKIINNSMIANASNISYELKLYGPDGNEFFNHSNTAKEILMSSYVRRDIQVSLPQDIIGICQAKVYVRKGGALSESITEPFEIKAREIPQSILLSGSIHVNPKKIDIGGNLELDYSITNSGNVDSEDIKTSIEITRPDEELVIKTWDTNISLLNGESISDTVMITELNEPAGYYMVLLSAYPENEQIILDYTGFEIEDDYPPVIEYILSLPKGWSMISLPIISESKAVSDLFPEAVIVYDYKKDIGYERIPGGKELEIGTGYWILLNEATSYTLKGQPIELYSLTTHEDEWFMIGGCTSEAKPSKDSCSIGIIYRYVQDVGYQRILKSESLMPGKGYWILLYNVSDECELTVETIGENP